MRQTIGTVWDYWGQPSRSLFAPSEIASGSSADDHFSEKPPTGEVARSMDYILHRQWDFVQAPQLDTRIGDQPQNGLFLVRDNETKDLHYMSQIESRKSALTSRDYDILTGGESSDALRARDFVQWTFNNLDGTIIGVFDAALDALSMGFSLQEEIWEFLTTGDYAGFWRIKKMKDKDQRYFRFDTDPFGNLKPDTGIQLLSTGGYLTDTFSPDKFLLFVFQKRKDNWYGRPLGLDCAWYIWFKKVAMASWNVRLQKHGNPTIVGKMPMGTSPNKQADFKESLNNLTARNWITLPVGPEGQGFEIDLLEAQGSGEAGYLSFLTYLDGAISKRILGGTLTSDSGTRGARSLGTIHQEIRHQLAKFDGLALADAINDQTIRRIVRYNFPVDTPLPFLKFRMLPPAGRKELLDAFAVAQEIGVTIPEAWAREILEMPTRKEDEAILIPLQAAAAKIVGGGAGKTSPAPTPAGDNTEPVINFAERPYQRSPSASELAADLFGCSLILDNLEMAAMMMGVQAMQYTAQAVHEAIDTKYASRRGTLKPTTEALKVSIDLAPMKTVLTQTMAAAWCMGALTATEHLEKMGVRFAPNTFAKFAEPSSVIPSVGQTLKGFAGRLPVSSGHLQIILDNQVQYAYTLTTTIHRPLDVAIRTVLQEAIGHTTMPHLATGLTNIFLPYIGTGEDDAPALLDVVRMTVAWAFNQGRLFVYRLKASEIGGLEFCGAISKVKDPVISVNDGKVYGVGDARWDWLCPPVAPGDRSIVVAVASDVPLSAIPSPDPPPRHGFGYLLATQPEAA